MWGTGVPDEGSGKRREAWNARAWDADDSLTWTAPNHCVEPLRWGSVGSGSSKRAKGQSSIDELVRCHGFLGSKLSILDLLLLIYCIKASAGGLARQTPNRHNTGRGRQDWMKKDARREKACHEPGEEHVGFGHKTPLRHAPKTVAQLEVLRVSPSQI